MADILSYRSRAAQPTSHERRFGVYQHAPETFSLRTGYRAAPVYDSERNNRANGRALSRATAVDIREFE